MALIDDLRTRLTLVSAVITARLTGKAVEQYKEASEEMRYTPLEKLYDMEKDLQDRIKGEGGGSESGGGTSFSFGVMEGN
jgi:hypothetical protein